MAINQNAINTSVTILSDGFTIGGGTIPRTITIQGTDVTLSGNTPITLTLPATSGTIALEGSGGSGTSGTSGTSGSSGSSGTAGTSGTSGSSGSSGISGSSGSSGTSGTSGTSGSSGTSPQTIELTEEISVNVNIFGETIITIDPYAWYGYNVVEVRAYTDANTATITFEINGTAITGLSSISLTTASTTFTATASNVVSTGQVLSFDVVGTPSAQRVFASIKITRTGT